MVDFFRKIRTNLTDATILGATLSIASGLLVTILFLWAFLSTTIGTGVTLDANSETLLQINFNITMIKLPCDSAVVDVVDILGTDRRDVTKNVEKWQVDEYGRRMILHGKNREQQDIAHDHHRPELPELEASGVYAPSISEIDFDDYINEKPYVFVHFFAPWAIWCQRLEPTWEALAKEIGHIDEEGKDAIAVDVVKVDCIANPNLCHKQRIPAFPTLRFFKDGKRYSDYKDARTVNAFIDYLRRILERDKFMREMRRKQEIFEIKGRQGCMLIGYFLVNRVAGNFHVQARSRRHSLKATMANLSHTVNHFSFGTPLDRDIARRVADHPQFQKIHPLDGRTFINMDNHQAHHHYSKVVSTHFEDGGMMTKTREIVGYQMLAQSQIMHYEKRDVPEAKFSYDISPVAVVISSKDRRWYDFLVRVCASLAGTFTTMGIIIAVVYKPLKPKQHESQES